MGIFLLAASARGLFIAMLIIMIIVSLLFGFIVFMMLKPVKKPPEAVDPNNVRQLLAHRETQLTVELMNNKGDEAKKTELINKLRRVKSAQLLIDELVDEDKKIVGEVEAEEKERAKKPRAEKAAPAPSEKPAPKKKPAAKPVPKEEKPAEDAQPATQAQAAPAEKPAPKKKPAAARKKKDDMEFKPSEE